MAGRADCEAESEAGMMEQGKRAILFSSCDRCDSAVYAFPVVKKAVCNSCGKDKLTYHVAEVPESKSLKGK